MKAVRSILSSLFLAGILAGCVIVDRDHRSDRYHYHDDDHHCWNCR